jgi:nucleotide-binding universal stress UspA family protein
VRRAASRSAGEPHHRFRKLLTTVAARTGTLSVMNRPYRIVVGFDGSDSARRALDRAVSLAGYGSRLRVVYVAADAASGARGEQLLGEVERKLSERRVYGEAVQRVGNPAEQLIAAAVEEHADLLVVGDDRGALERSAPGSVSSALVQRAPCDLLLAR